MAMKPFTLRIPRSLLELAEVKSRAERTDKTTALRQLLYAGAEEYVLALVSEGRVSVGRGAELLDVNVHDLQRLAEDHGVELGATAEQYVRARETAHNPG